MKILKRIGLIVLALVVILGIGGFLIPRHYHLERSRTIAATAPEIQAQIVNLRNWPNWSPWHAMDPGMSITYSEPAAGAGAWYSWKSQELGDGKMTLTHVAPDSVRESMDFGMGEPATAGFYFTPQGESATSVRWTMDTDLGMNPFFRWFSFAMEGMLGKDYERGLANLAAQTEKK